MSTLNLSVMYRPIKIGFLLSDGDIKTLVEIAGINTLLWGGIYNPIIPVSDKNNYTDKFIKGFSVDALCMVKYNTSLDYFFKKYKYLQLDYFLHKKSIFFDDKKSLIAFLDSYNAIYNIWENYFKNKKENEINSNFAFVKWSKDDRLADFFAISFGYFPENINLRENYKKAYLNGLQAKEIILNSNKTIDYDFIKKHSPLSITKYGLKSIFDRFIPGYGIFIGDETNFDDLVSFWNLRSSGHNIIFIPERYIEKLQESLNKFINYLDERPVNIKGIDDFINIYYSSIDENQIKNVINKIHTKKEISCCCVNKYFLSNMVGSAKYYFEDDNILGIVSKSYDNYNVNFKLPKKHFLNNSISKSKHQRMAVSIKPLMENLYPDHTLKPPYIPELNTFYGREIIFNPFNIRIEKGRTTVLIDNNEDFLSLYPLNYQKIFERIFNYAYISNSISQAGIITKRIIEKLGSLEGGRVFKIKGVRKLFKELKTGKNKTRKEILEIIHDEGSFKKYEGLFIEARDKKKLNADDVFNYLLKKDFLRAGLEFTCEHCKLKDWVSLKDLDDYWTCKFCGYSNKVSFHLNKEGEWKYIKSGLLAKDNNQEGAIPVILTLLFFKRIFMPHGMFIFSPSLQLKINSINCEIDFCILQNDRNGNVEIGIAECKDQGGQIDQEDINHFKLAIKEFKRVGVKCYPIFSKIGEFTTQEIDLFRSLTKENIDYILLTTKEIEPFDPYEEYKEKKLPKKHPIDLCDIAMNSKYIYIDEFNSKAINTKYYEV